MKQWKKKFGCWTGIRTHTLGTPSVPNEALQRSNSLSNCNHLQEMSRGDYSGHLARELWSCVLKCVLDSYYYTLRFYYSEGGGLRTLTFRGQTPWPISNVFCRLPYGAIANMLTENEDPASTTVGSRLLTDRQTHMLSPMKFWLHINELIGFQLDGSLCVVELLTVTLLMARDLTEHMGQLLPSRWCF